MILDLLKYLLFYLFIYLMLKLKQILEKQRAEKLGIFSHCLVFIFVKASFLF